MNYEGDPKDPIYPSDPAHSEYDEWIKNHPREDDKNQCKTPFEDFVF